jgi:hypothetical protein
MSIVLDLPFIDRRMTSEAHDPPPHPDRARPEARGKQTPHGGKRPTSDVNHIWSPLRVLAPISRKELAMALDQSKIGRVVAEQMEAIEGDYDDDSEIGDVCTIVEVVGPHGSHVRVRSSDMRPHSGLGLVRMAEQAMLGNLGGS